MKKLLTMAFMLGAFVVFANTATPNENNNDSKDKKAVKKEVKATVNTEDSLIQVRKPEEERVKKMEEAIYCHAKNGEKEASCWFCDCEALTKQVMSAK